MKKNKKKLLIIFSLLITILTFFGLFIYFETHIMNAGDNARYIWVFKDSAQHNIDKSICFGNIGRHDVNYSYIYKDDVHIYVWEFFDLKSVLLKNIPINYRVDLDKIKIPSGEILGGNNLPPLPKIRVKYGLTFKGDIKVNINKDSEIFETFDELNYKGFFGNIHRITFSDDYNEHLIVFDYEYNEPTLLLLCKKLNRFYVVIINSKRKFDSNIIEILNLN
jgi:hypothetical protein